jgi:hypothetical protein
MEQIPNAPTGDVILGVETELDDLTVHDEVKISHDPSTVGSQCKITSAYHPIRPQLIIILWLYSLN